MVSRKIRTALNRRVVALFFVLGVPAMTFAETVGVFFDAVKPMESFAAGDVKAALESKGFTVEMQSLASLASSYANKKVVIALGSNSAVTSVLTAQGGTVPTGLGEQAYALRTTTTPQTSYWVLGGDNNGAMYGGFQVTENIKINGFTGTYNSQEAPHIKERGAKMNMPLDGRSPTYNNNFAGESSKRAIANVWDLNFWKEWFDEKARNRFNLLTFWCNHPFTAMVKVPGYEDCYLTDVQDASGKVIKTMSIDEKIAFWKQVHAYAHSRGFKFYIMNWNLYTLGCTGKHGITDAATDPETQTYMTASMNKLLETYPDLDGFGCTAGENMSEDATTKEAFLWKAYGEPMLNCAKANPNRKLTFVHRIHQSSYSNINQYFAPLLSLPNTNLCYSIKYSQAHFLSTTCPTVWSNDKSQVINANRQLFFTVRNDDLYLHDWGDPAYARNYYKCMPDGNPAHMANVTGFYLGSDSYNPTRTYQVKDVSRQNELELTRNWFFEMVWGRLAYNPNLPDEAFKAAIKLRYPQVNENTFFNAWCNASKAFQVGNEAIVGKYEYDYQYYPEAQQKNRAYISLSDLKSAKLAAGSNFASPLAAADSAIKCGEAALAALNGMSSGGNGELQSKIKNLQSLTCLALCVGQKLRAAFTSGATATAAAGKAYCYWLAYADLMDAQYIGQTFRTATVLPNYHCMDANFLDDYGSAGGSGTPTCQPIVGIKPVSVSADKKQTIGVCALSTRAITLFLPNDQGFSIEIFKSNGIKVGKLSKPRITRGISRFFLGKKLPQGVYMVRLTSAGQTVMQLKNVVTQ